MPYKASLVKKAASSLARYCAMGERSPRQVQDKLQKFSLSEAQVAEVIDKLISDGFLNESRFASAFCHDKLRFNSWGKSRLRMELRAHKISAEHTEEALSEISDEVYTSQLTQVLKKKLRTISSETEALMKKKKLTDHAIRKGFEPGLVFSVAEKIMSAERQ